MEQQLWDKCLKAIESKVEQSTFELWIKPSRLLNVKEGIATVEVPNRFYKEWIEDSLPNLLPDVISEVLGKPITVKYKIAEKQDTEIKKIERGLEQRKARLADRGIFLNPKYTFNNFVEGDSNKFASAAAKAVADSPGGVYNPLFIYGGVGLGKTHLMSAVGNQVFDKRHDFRIAYVSSEQFTNEVVFSIRHSKMEELKNKYRNLDLLLIDDIQAIENKTATQEELFHTLNSLYEKQKQIVISSDRPPKEIKAVTDRLRSRFGMGLIAEIITPEVETKIAIIEKKAANEKINIPREVIEFIAHKIKSNIRDLESCIIRLGAHSALTGSHIDVQGARTILKDFIPEEDTILTVEGILKTVSDHFGVKVADLKAKKRTKEVALPRQIAMHLARELTHSSLSDIGKGIGGKDHATVIYACKQVELKKTADEGFKRMIENLINKLKP